METAAIIELISAVGFPIAACLALGFFIWTIYKQSVTREEKLMTEITENRLINTKFAEIIAQYEITLGEMRTDIHDIKETLHMNNQ